MHIQSQQSIVSRSDSPPDNGAHIMLHHIQSQETLYNLQPSQNGMYTTSHTNHIHPNSDYAVDIDPQKQLASKINDGPPSFRSPFSGFTSAARSRHHNAPSMLTSPTSYRESSTFYPICCGYVSPTDDIPPPTSICNRSSLGAVSTFPVARR